MREIVSFETIQEGLALVFEQVESDSGIQLQISRHDRHSHENSQTFYQGYEGPLPGAAIKEAKVDITIQEKIVFPIVKD